MKTLYTVSPRGWCAGVERAIEIVETALKHLTPPIYVRREIVHNKIVVESLMSRGVRFIEELDEAPSGAAVIFSAHGVSPEVWEKGIARGLKIIDATCPLVTKVHLEVQRFVNDGFTILYIGHKNHDEAVGVLGEAPGKIHIIETEEEARRFESADKKLMLLTQTTLSVDDTKRITAALKERFPELQFPPKEDICYATTNRQNAVRFLLESRAVNLVYVIGSKNSSNSNRLCEVAESMGVAARLIDTAADIRVEDWEGKAGIGLTAGASAPESLVEEVAAYFKTRGYGHEEIEFQKEEVSFALPKELIALEVAHV